MPDLQWVCRQVNAYKDSSNFFALLWLSSLFSFVRFDLCKAETRRFCQNCSQRPPLLVRARRVNVFSAPSKVHFTDVAAGHFPAMLLEIGDDSSGIAVGVFERHLFGEKRGGRTNDTGIAIERTKDRSAVRTLVDVPRDASGAIGRLVGLRLESL